VSWNCKGTRHLQAMDGKRCTQLIKNAGQSRCWTQAHALLVQAVQHILQTNTIIYNAAAGACMRGQQWQRSLNLANEVSTRGLLWDTVSWNSAMHAQQQGQQWPRALQSFLSMLERDHALSVVTCNTAMKTAASGQLWRYALELLATEMPRRKILPDVITYNTAISACEKDQQWEWGLRLLADMRNADLLPDRVSYNTAISACEKGRHWQGALALLQEMQRVKIVLDSISYNAAISACEKGQMWQVALDLLGAMGLQKVDPDTISYNAAISACEKCQQWQWPLLLLEEMCRHQVASSTHTFNAVMSALDGGKQWQRSLGFLAGLRRRVVEPNVITFSTAMSACCGRLSWRWALDIFALIKQNGVQPNSVTCSTAISALDRAGAWKGAIRVVGEMNPCRVASNIVVAGAAIWACEAGQHWQGALFLLAEACQGGAAPNCFLLNGAVLACIAAGKWERALQISDGLRLDAMSRDSLLMMCEQQGLAEHETRLLLGMAGKGTSCMELALRGLPDPVAVAVAAAVRLLHARRRPKARQLLRSAASAGEWSRAAEQVWASCDSSIKRSLGMASLQPVRLQQQRAALPQRPSRTQYSKELCMLAYVLRTATAGNASSVCRAIDEFSENVWKSSGVWAKSAGNAKAEIVSAAVSPAHPTGGGILEIGTYCGYCTIQMAAACPAACITTLEADSMHVVVARNLVAVAGLSNRVDVWTGHSGRTLPWLARNNARGKDGCCSKFGAVLMDRWGSHYPEDLDELEKGGLLREGAVLVADNILRTGASLFVWRVAGEGTDYATAFMPVHELASGSEDWLAVSVLQRGSRTNAPLVAETPIPLVVMHQEAERMRELVIGPKSHLVTLSERAAFAKELRTVLREMNIVASVDPFGQGA